MDNKIIAESPDDVLVRFQLAIAHHNFGVVLTKQGKNEAAIEAFRKAQKINQALVKEFPKTPSYAGNLATNLDSLALALDAAGQPGADQNFGAATTIYERLISSYPANVDYPIWEANCLRNQGLVLAEAGRIHDAHALYRKALNLLESVDAILQTPDGMRKQAVVLSNLAHCMVQTLRMHSIARLRFPRSFYLARREQLKIVSIWQSATIISVSC